MSTPGAEVGGQITTVTEASEYATLSFVIRQHLMKMQTAMVVKVMGVSNAGGVSPVGTVDIQPMVNQRAGNGVAVPHGTIYGIPYMRIQGGADAVILDPKVGDLGVAVFASRDISAVKKNKGQANPGSARTYNYADGLYIGGLLNGVPTQYVQFSSDGITLVSPTKVKIQAPDIDIEGATSITLNAPEITIEGGGTSIDGKNFLLHMHSGVTTGGDPTGPVE